jgi:hypothetical protein
MMSPTTTKPVAMPISSLAVGYCAYLPERLDDFDAGVDRSRCIVFVSMRESEVRQNAVAHVSGNEAIVARDNLARAFLIAAYDIAQVLGVERVRQLGRSHEIAKHHGELAALGFHL